MNTIKTIVDAVSALRDTPADAAPSLSRALRFYRAKNLIHATNESSGQGKEGEFDEENAAYALILCHVYLLNMDGAAAAEARHVFDRTEAVIADEGPTNRAVSMARVLKGIRKGETWQLVFRSTTSGLRARAVQIKDQTSQPFAHVPARVVLHLNDVLAKLVEA